MQISKTDFIHYLNCPKSLWLLKHKPDQYPHGEFSDYMKKLTSEGYDVEAQAQKLIHSQPDAASYSFQSVFQTPQGLYAKADVIRDNGDGIINFLDFGTPQGSFSVFFGSPPGLSATVCGEAP